MPRRSDPARAIEWARRFKRFEASSLSVARFCRSERVSTPSFYHWKRKLRGTAVPEPPKLFRPVHVLESSPGNRTRTQQGTIVRLANGVQIRLGSDWPVVEFVLKRLLDAPVINPDSRRTRSC